MHTNNISHFLADHGLQKLQMILNALNRLLPNMANTARAVDSAYYSHLTHPSRTMQRMHRKGSLGRSLQKHVTGSRPQHVTQNITGRSQLIRGETFDWHPTHRYAYDESPRLSNLRSTLTSHAAASTTPRKLQNSFATDLLIAWLSLLKRLLFHKLFGGIKVPI